MIFFPSRKEARAFASKRETYSVKDNGTASPEGLRWGVKVI